MPVTLSRSAAHYMRRETLYLQGKSPSAAKRFVATIREACRNLERFPDMGKEQSGLPIPDARTWVVGDYLLDYTRNGSRIEIVLIRHGRMKPLTPDIEDDLD